MNADGGRKKQRAEGRKHIAVVKVTKSRKTGRGYTTSRNAIKASIRYISHRPNQEGERQTRTLFGRDGEDVSKWQAYDFVNSMRPGTKFVRIIISPDAKREDSNRALHMRRVTLRTIAALERRLGRDVQFIACVHDDHTENRHVHVIATVSRRLGVSDFREMREAATAACRTQGREWEQKRSRSRSRHLNRGKTGGREISATATVILPAQAKPPCPQCGGEKGLKRLRTGRLWCPDCRRTLPDRQLQITEEQEGEISQEYA